MSQESVVCNDSNGLCLFQKGSLPATNNFTSLVRLANQLNSSEAQPLITIETPDSAILIKEYEGHTVAVQVPRPAAS